jgi:hypothetical protein
MFSLMKLRSRNVVAFILLLALSLFLLRLYVASTTTTKTYYLLNRDVSAGSQLVDSDFSATQLSVELDDDYQLTISEAVGKRARVPLRAGHLLTQSVLTNEADLLLVSLPIRAGNIPSLPTGATAQVWLTPNQDSLDPYGASRLVVEEVIIEQIPEASDLAMDSVVSVLVHTDEVATLLSVASTGDIHLVGQP